MINASTPPASVYIARVVAAVISAMPLSIRMNTT